MSGHKTNRKRVTTANRKYSNPIPNPNPNPISHLFADQLNIDGISTLDLPFRHTHPPRPLIWPTRFVRSSLFVPARVERLDSLKTLAKEYVQRPEVQARAKELRRILRGESNSSGWPSIGGGGGGGDGGGDGGGGGGGKGKSEGVSSSSSSSSAGPGSPSANPPSPPPAPSGGSSGVAW